MKKKGAIGSNKTRSSLYYLNSNHPRFHITSSPCQIMNATEGSSEA